MLKYIMKIINNTLKSIKIVFKKNNKLINQ